MERRRRGAPFSFLLPVNPRVRENACTPPSVMRMVCNPGTEACPRSFMICNFRTTEFRSATCESQKRPSATVNSGIVADLFHDILADQKRRGLPTGQKLGEPLDERLHLHFARAAKRFAHDGAKGIHDHDLGFGRRRLAG